ncbi:hypothetical protein KIN20_004439 [Parelaphostrongylus tenuis]|uniref:mannosyl-oligosaccharide 1,3-1,6-alpha-mannosidase n=1 Tax=Parelaphostrongylus tenuis TaxID=148309 RepID=A0AAD5M1Q6_PARTN|nr:hypothetical protein KIN20_004439 [Parelaphostrongylus tenuis]
MICTFFIVCLYLYHSIDTKAAPGGSYLLQTDGIDKMKEKVDQLQTILESNRNEISSLKQELVDLEKKERERLRKTTATSSHQRSSSVCLDRQNYTSTHSDVQMLDVYDLLAFDNPDGGAWKQGWEVTYDKSKVAGEKTLQVIVIPHSHCDPGWLKTFEQYHLDQTSKILDGMVKHLSDATVDMRFIYAEMSFFELWWRNQTESTKSKVRELLKSGKFEIVTGGWQIDRGFFCVHHLFVVSLNPFFLRISSNNSLVDRPFGLSPSLPYLLRAANITDAAIQRVHYSVKKHLAKNKQLEFMWRQLWGAHGNPMSVLICFHFIRMTCLIHVGRIRKFVANLISEGFLEEELIVRGMSIHRRSLEKMFVVARLLFNDQYRKKSQLYKTNVLLVPLGDDFRYVEDFEWSTNIKNYMKLFDEMNNNKKWNINARFGTLSDYFAELDRSLRVEQQSLPILSGDFFTYSDRDDHYWSGYFTSRPFYKQMDRVLQHQLRAAEIVFTLWSMKGQHPSDTIFAKLMQARRALSLFQHHDGVTGTAKQHVMKDYGTK